MTESFARRDRAMGALANLVLRFASKHYREMVRGSIAYGLNAAAQDAHKGEPAPSHWHEYVAGQCIHCPGGMNDNHNAVGNARVSVPVSLSSLAPEQIREIVRQDRKRRP